MKYLLGLLIIVNLVFYFWISRQPIHPVLPDPVVVSGAARLTLLSEQEVVLNPRAASADSDKQPQPAGVSKGPVVSFIEVSCYSLGPFSGVGGAGEAANTLKSLGLLTTIREETRRELRGYWIYLPPFPSRKDAIQVTRMLKERGVKDFLIVPSGSKKNAISLGFFRSRESAEQHRARIQALGLLPQFDENYRENNGFWLDFASLNKPPLPAVVVEALQEQYGDIDMRASACP